MLDSTIRTVVPIIVGVIVGQAARIGLDLPADAVTAILTPTVSTLYYIAARAIEQHVPAAGRWLLALGLTSARPVYRP
ncbi:hypothetical protein amrb99_98370 [Actinomadura sp. RB99]|uniref:hypothetical protein n=1 Tax=Actinomadura sp. RB99 TaxID=2691577 RepID=UPI001686A192|nr:hypothetical protein [Actinomadura sp. RB99]MBD2900827.1 hypothetical protein [Actinomadura sp. RB99]